MFLNFLIQCILFCIFQNSFFVTSATCKSNEYCPQNWEILRRNDQSAYTCDPMNGEVKCPKPYKCVHSKCGIAFCCAHLAALENWRREKEIEEEILKGENDGDDGEL
ncbi:unnamed protein product, partial [Mesorhabditis belari]|uniref:Uncharacterized protein n=1 Tax=Mesorhabditis belari TaxID=2138241 RepID=A0AAF3JBI1_9BILA